MSGRRRFGMSGRRLAWPAGAWLAALRPCIQGAMRVLTTLRSTGPSTPEHNQTSQAAGKEKSS